MNTVSGNILDKINSPADLKKLDEEFLPDLCDEVRAFIIDVMSKNPGHLGASLGTVELSIALHYVFNTPEDRLVWDVGHQAYTHKILTGRKERFHTNRKWKGLSGFPKRSESEYDSFGTGHSSTSISAALGMAIAATAEGNSNRQHIAVIGDGSMTGGMAFEALNHAGASNANLLIILNDNGIAIDQNVGALKEYLIDITSSRYYNKLKDIVWKLLGGGTRYGHNTRAIVRQVQAAIKGSILRKANFFETLNFRYFGPVDGHDVLRLTKLLGDLKRIPGPKVLHIITKKGKGLPLAERNQTKYHSPGTFDKNTGEIHQPECDDYAPKYQVVFGKTIIELAKENPKIVAVTPAMASGCSLDMMISIMPERVFDVGIAEQHAVTFSAGMAAEGLIPFCNIYSSFLQRAYDQIIHDLALQKLPVILCIDRGGLVGEDGPTHHGVFDLAYLRCIPDLIVAAPMNEEELRNMMYSAQLKPVGPYAIRYPRGRGVMRNWNTEFKYLETGKGRLITKGDKLAILSIGHPGNFVTQALELLKKDEINPSHYDMRFVKPLDEELLEKILEVHSHIICIEDGTVIGGFGTAVEEYIAKSKHKPKLKKLGVPDKFIEHGEVSLLYNECGIDAKSIRNEVLNILESNY